MLPAFDVFRFIIDAADTPLFSPFYFAMLRHVVAAML